MTSQDTQERWKPVLGFQGIAEVSDHGRIRTVDRVTSHGHRRAGQLRKVTYTGTPDATGRRPYAAVLLSKNGKKHLVLVHRAVLEAFVGPCPTGQQCRHLNGDSRYNWLGNLCWGTLQENMEDQRKHGTLARRERHGHAKLTETSVANIRQQARKKSVAEIVASVPVGQSQVRRILAGESWV